MKTLRELAEEMLNTCDAVIREHGGVEPLVILYKRGEKLYLPPHQWLPEDADFNDRRVRSAFAEAIRSIIKLIEADQYLYCSEVWITQLAPDDPKADDPDYSPSDDPKRWEALQVLTEDVEGNQVSVLSPIIRPAGKDAHLDITNAQWEGDLLIGRLSGMFDAVRERSKKT